MYKCKVLYFSVIHKVGMGNKIYKNVCDCIMPIGKKNHDVLYE